MPKLFPSLEAPQDGVVIAVPVVQVVGVKGPLPDKTYSMELNPPIDMGWHHQSVAFIVL